MFAQSLYFCSAEVTVIHSIHTTVAHCKFNCTQAGQWPWQIYYLLINSHKCMYEAKQSFEYVQISVCLLFISVFLCVCLLRVPVGPFLYTLQCPANIPTLSANPSTPFPFLLPYPQQRLSHACPHNRRAVIGMVYTSLRANRSLARQTALRQPELRGKT